MTRIVTTVQAADADALIARAKQAGGDLAEVRLDGLDAPSPEAARRIVDAVERPILVTFRSEGEGGRAHDVELREAALQAAVEAEPAWVDLEVGDRDLLDLAADAETRIVVSRHRDEPVGSGRLLADLETARALGADVAKAVMPVDGPGDVDALLDAARQARSRGWSYAVMGLGDSVVRALAPSLDMALVYAAPTGGEAAAPGQLPLDLAENLRDVQVRTEPVRLAGVLGEDVRASLSPPMHNAAFAAAGVPAVYVPLSVDPEDFDAVAETLPALPFFGVNVTIPYKEAILDHLDDVDEVAKQVGAVNTVQLEGDRSVGYNTDVAGIRRALAERPVPDGPLLVIGAGGAARAAVAAADADREVRVANRTPDRARQLVRELGGEAFALDDVDAAAEGAAVVVNATPVSPEVAWPLTRDDAVALDLVYRPRRTAFLDAASRAGRATVTGDRVLLYQAAEAFEIWTRHDAPVPIMDRALEVAYDRDG